MTDIYLFKIENIFESNRQNFRINLYNKLKNKKKISMKDANDH
jgi:hypothetical protein